MLVRRLGAGGYAEGSHRDIDRGLALCRFDAEDQGAPRGPVGRRRRQHAEELDALIRKETKMWGDVVKARKITRLRSKPPDAPRTSLSRKRQRPRIS